MVIWLSVSILNAFFLHISEGCGSFGVHKKYINEKKMNK